jgi:hypothetical protein
VRSGARSRPAALRYTKAALLLFGLGLALGFAIVVGGFDGFGWIASALMALGLVLLPPALLADGKGLAVRAWLARLPRRRRRKPRAKPRTTAPRGKSRRSGGRRPARPPTRA